MTGNFLESFCQNSKKNLGSILTGKSWEAAVRIQKKNMDSILAGDFLGSFFQNSHKRYGFNSDRQPPAKLRSEFEKFMGSRLTGNFLGNFCQKTKQVGSILTTTSLESLWPIKEIWAQTLQDIFRTIFVIIENMCSIRTNKRFGKFLWEIQHQVWIQILQDIDGMFLLEFKKMWGQFWQHISWTISGKCDKLGVLGSSWNVLSELESWGAELGLESFCNF